MTELVAKGSAHLPTPHSMRSWRRQKPRLDCDISEK